MPFDAMRYDNANSLADIKNCIQEGLDDFIDTPPGCFTTFVFGNRFITEAQRLKDEFLPLVDKLVAIEANTASRSFVPAEAINTAGLPDDLIRKAKELDLETATRLGGSTHTVILQRQNAGEVSLPHLVSVVVEHTRDRLEETARHTASLSLSRRLRAIKSTIMSIKRGHSDSALQSQVAAMQTDRLLQAITAFRGGIQRPATPASDPQPVV